MGLATDQGSNNSASGGADMFTIQIQGVVQVPGWANKGSVYVVHTDPHNQHCQSIVAAVS